MNLTPSDLTWQEPTERKRKKLNPHFDAFLAVLAEHAGQWAVWSTTDKATRTQYLRNCAGDAFEWTYRTSKDGSVTIFARAKSA